MGEKLCPRLPLSCHVSQKRGQNPLQPRAPAPGGGLPVLPAPPQVALCCRREAGSAHALSGQYASGTGAWRSPEFGVVGELYIGAYGHPCPPRAHSAQHGDPQGRGKVSFIRPPAATPGRAEGTWTCAGRGHTGRPARLESPRVWATPKGSDLGPVRSFIFLRSWRQTGPQERGAGKARMVPL